MLNSLRTLRFLRRRTYIFGALLCIPFLPAALAAQESVFTLDPAHTKIEFTLPATGHTVHGAFKLTSGQVRFDTASGKASGKMIADAASGESGNDSRDKKMHQEIIQSAKFPEIVFTPTHVQGVVAPEGTSQVEVTGVFRLCGVDHSITMTFAVERLAGNQLKVATHFSLPYVEWGLKNPSGFLLRVDKAVGVDIHAAGQLTVPVTNH